MKKRVISLCLVLVLISALFTPVNAATNYDSGASCVPTLSISGTTARCSLRVIAEHSTDGISATIKLKNTNGITVKTWYNVTGTGNLFFNDTYGIVRNQTYELIATVTVTGDAGTDTITVSATANS